jgi:ribose transport system permease protein
MHVTTERFGRRVLRAVTKQKAVVAILVMLIAMIFFKTNFYTSYNLLNVLKDAAVNEIIAFGVTLTVIAAGCDLSVGGVMCLSGIVAIQLMNGGMNMWLAILLAILSGAVVGFINGFLVVKQKTEAFIITLGMGMLIKGVCQQLTDAHPVSCTNMEYMKIANGKIGGVIPNLAVYMIVIGLLIYSLLRFTSFAETSTPSAATTRWRNTPASGHSNQVGRRLSSAALWRRSRACCSPASSTPVRASMATTRR